MGGAGMTDNSTATETVAEVDYSEQHLPVEQDGWTLIHSAIRLDVSDTKEALTRLIAASTVEDWEWEGLVKWWVHVATEIHLHHDHEERFFFPAIYKRCCQELQERYSHSHEELMTKIKDVTGKLQEAANSKDKPM